MSLTKEMELDKLSKKDLLLKCESLGIQKCKSKKKNELINLIIKKNSKKIKKKKFIIQDDKNIYDDIILNDCDNIKDNNYDINDDINHDINYDKNTIINTLEMNKIIDNDNKLSDGLIFENERFKLFKGDCLEYLEKIEDKSIQLICIDPPYNIGKDVWDNIDNYNCFILNVIKKLEKKLKDNGSFFIFHNDMEIISELMINIKKETKFIFKQMIVWNKRFDNSSKKGFMDGFVVKNDMHNFNKMVEYILFYTFDNSYKLEKRRKELNISQLTISQEIKSKSGGITGWYSNLETGKNMPTRETIKPIEKHLGLTYEDIVPKFNNMKTHHSVWNYDMAKRCKVHITPKPIDLLKNIIYHTTDEDDYILDCFGGSGSMGYASLETNRKCILIEKEEKYCKYIKEELLKLNNM